MWSGTVTDGVLEQTETFHVTIVRVTGGAVIGLRNQVAVVIKVDLLFQRTVCNAHVI